MYRVLDAETGAHAHRLCASIRNSSEPRRDDTYLGFRDIALWDEGAGTVISICWLLLPLPGCPEGTKSSNPSIAMKTMPSSTMGPQAMPLPARSRHADRAQDRCRSIERE